MNYLLSSGRSVSRPKSRFSIPLLDKALLSLIWLRLADAANPQAHFRRGAEGSGSLPRWQDLWKCAEAAAVSPLRWKSSSGLNILGRDIYIMLPRRLMLGLQHQARREAVKGFHCSSNWRGLAGSWWASKWWRAAANGGKRVRGANEAMIVPGRRGISLIIFRRSGATYIDCSTEATYTLRWIRQQNVKANFNLLHGGSQSLFIHSIQHTMKLSPGNHNKLVVMPRILSYIFLWDIFLKIDIRHGAVIKIKCYGSRRR